MYFFVIDNSLRLHVIIFDLLKVEEHKSIYLWFFSCQRYFKTLYFAGLSLSGAWLLNQVERPRFLNIDRLLTCASCALNCPRR